ncbi:MAG: hypothetical protein R3F34_16105 [Planctomycetota bacterium]
MKNHATRTVLLSVAATAASLAVASCEAKTPPPSSSGTSGTASSTSGAAGPFGFAAPYSVSTIATGLMNPSFVSFDAEGRATVCDSGHGKVLVADAKGELEDWATGFDTEYWKVDAEKGTKRFLLGPLAALWLPDGRLAVTDGGKKDGEEAVLVYDKGELDESSNTVPPTTEDPADKGEGNLCGLSMSPDQRYLWVCGQGADAKTWVLRYDVRSQQLEPWLSADDHGIVENSPMQTLPLSNERLLVLYEGTGGAEDGRIVEWDVTRREPVHQWTLPGLVDPMGIAKLPKGEGYVVVDNNWALTEVLKGKVAKVTLPSGGGAAKVEVIADAVPGPVSCAFAPDGRLFVTMLGERFDAELGQVIAVSGF